MVDVGILSEDEMDRNINGKMVVRAQECKLLPTDKEKYEPNIKYVR